MYKIMLADDEGIVIESLKFIIEKHFGEECEIESAKTGRKVIELAESFRPDIAFMDIQMPGINGIEAMKEIRRFNTSTIFIVMTAYDKFDYAKEAINLGVMEYLNKPVRQDQIVDVLKRAMKKIDDKRERRAEDLIIKEKLETVSPIIESGLIYNILFHEHFDEDINSYRTLLDIEQENAYMLAFVYGDDQDGNHMTNAVGSSVRIQQYYQDIRGYIKEYFAGSIVGTIMSNKIAVLVPYDEEDMDYATRSALIERSREFTRNMRKHTDISFRIGIGRVKNFRDMSESYSEALNSLIVTSGSVAAADDLPIGCEYESDYPAKTEKDLFDAVEKGDTQMALNQTSSFFDWMMANHAEHVMDIKLKVLEFVLWAEHLAYLQGGKTYHFLSRGDYLPELLSMDTMEELKKWFMDKVNDACHNVNVCKDNQSNTAVEKAKSYIDSHYSNKDLSLDEVSREVDISPYYFSKLFKEETGENFIEYLTNIRLNKAKALLNDSNYSMKQICMEIGYADPNYFSRTFKKNFGVTPTEYKEGMS